MQRREVQVKVCGREFTVLEPTFGDVHAAGGDAIALMQRCVVELTTDEEVAQLTAFAGERLLTVLNELMSTGPD